MSAMLNIPEQDITNRMKLDNPWWQDTDGVLGQDMQKRSYFNKFYALVSDLNVKRAAILMGPRRVGKTVIIHQTILKLIEDMIVSAHNIMFVSIDTPVYVGLSLEKILKLFLNEKSLDEKSQAFIFFDEIQYLQNWEIHLKDLVDRYPNMKFVASGSAAAALKLKSNESGAGRFTDFILPPLTFAEFIDFSKQNDLIIKSEHSPTEDRTTDIDKLNAAFIDYINFGGYPEVVMNPAIRKDPKRFIKHDIIDKVLLKDLPSLYGIRDMRELNRLFTSLAYFTGTEINLEDLSQSSQVQKAQVKKYLEYLEEAFLIATVTKVNETGKYFIRQRQFKVYLTNPSMRAALFGPVSGEDKAMGALAETAIFSQWLHSPEMETIHYARWKDGEIDLVKISNEFKPVWAYEIKWSDRYFDNPTKLKSLIKFSKVNEFSRIGCSTKTKTGTQTVADVEIAFFPSSLHCYQIARRITNEDD